MYSESKNFRIQCDKYCTSVNIFTPSSSRVSVIKGLDFYPSNMDSSSTGTHVSYWRHQEGHPAKTDPM